MAEVNLPSGYMLCDYIESNGSQCIDTGIAPNQNTRVVMHFRLTDTTASEQWLYGADKFGFYYDGSFGAHYGDALFGGLYGKTDPLSDTIVDQNGMNILIDNTYEGELMSATFTSTDNIVLLGKNNGDKVVSTASARLYSCQIYDNGVLVRDYIPCQNPNGKYGLWDSVNNQFYTNSYELQPTIAWSVSSGTKSETANTSAYDGKTITLNSPGQSSSTIVRCTFSNVKSITFNCVSNGEDNYDYLNIGNIDTACTRTSYAYSLKGKSGAATDYTYEADSGEHYVEFCYSKDSSTNASPDNASVYIKSVELIAVKGFLGKWVDGIVLKVSPSEFRRRLMMSVTSTNDLSMCNIYGNITSQNTANCYVIKEAGTYKFPLVFGNAIKNGTTNIAAYTKVVGTYSHDFVDYNDSIITSPYIETVSGTASSVELSMADTDAIFSNMSIVDGTNCRYIQFNVDSIPSTGANGVISVLDSSSKVMWSWHIWVWSDDLTPVTITNSTGVDYNILPVNLATKKSSTTEGKIYNWFYQWGRPTPMLPPEDYNSTTNATNYGTKAFAVSSAKADTYGAGIQNPQIFYKSLVAPYNWFGTSSYYNLWDAGCVSTGSSDNTVVKTVYDPCPPGFKMPNGNTFSYFSTSNVVGSFNDGWYFKRNAEDTTGVFFPASGYRHKNSGSIYHVVENGYVWLSSSHSQAYANYLYFHSGNVKPQSAYDRAYGYSVRPVQEESGG